LFHRASGYSQGFKTRRPVGTLLVLHVGEYIGGPYEKSISIGYFNGLKVGNFEVVVSHFLLGMHLKYRTHISSLF